MSAEEFAEWAVMFSAEDLHPNVERLQHAQTMAALHNGPLTRKSKKLWSASEFIVDRWAPDAPRRKLTPAQISAQVKAHNARFRNRGQ